MNKQQQVIKEEREMGKAPLSQMCIYIDDTLGVHVYESRVWWFEFINLIKFTNKL